MAGLARDIYYEQYQECAALYDEKKWEECKKVGIRNMADCTMPRYLHIRTLILIAEAEEYSWYKGECYRVEAERLFAVTKRLMAERAANATSAEKALNEATIAQLRTELDKILEYQANDAPSWVSLEGAEYPERDGSLKDFLAARQMFADAEIAEAEMLAQELAQDEEDLKCFEEDSDDADKYGDVEGEKTDVQQDVKLERNSVDIPLKGTAAVKTEDHQHVQDIAQRLQDIILSDQTQEALSVSASKSALVTEEKQFAGTTKKKHQSKLHWRPWE